jgi:hypothetical protein
MQYEEVVRCCLDYLNRHLTAPSSKPVVDSRSQAKLHIIFACGGNGARWDRFLGLPKQKVDTGDGVPLIQRTINQFSSRFPGVSLSILLRKSDKNDFCDIQNIGRIYTTQGPDTPVCIEILETIRRSPMLYSDILWVYGDVFFSELAVFTIMDTLLSNPQEIKYFGRKQINPKYGNTGGEIFAVFAPLRFKTFRLALQRLSYPPQSEIYLPECCSTSPTETIPHYKSVV